MSYVSLTKPGVARGPHEHKEQSDYFCFVGPSTFRLYLWDNRVESATYKKEFKIDLGQNFKAQIIVPPGVVHAYKNIGDKDGFVFNAPNRLYEGQNRKFPADEIRHEDDPDSPYQLDN
jgi:dTDP-4-dehydrorhamnose 3,5-epimerase